MYALRPYQRQAVDAVYDYLRNKDGAPCVVLPTAAGKSGLMATIARDAVLKWNGRVLILAHVKELLEQTANTIRRIAPDLPIGVYSAGLNSRCTKEPVIVAGIQSVYKRACELERFDLILVDECHLIPPSLHAHSSGRHQRPTGAGFNVGAVAPSASPASDTMDGEGMYQTFLKDAKIINPRVRLIGLTATPYRLKSGLLCGPENLLNEICYEIGIKELIERGFLCPLKSKSGRRQVDCSSLPIRGGEFVADEVETLMNTTDNVYAACREIIAQTQNRHSILIFGASVAHAIQIQKTIEKLTSLECGLVAGETPNNERDRILRRFKGEQFVQDLFGNETKPLRFLVNVNVLTTGFDAPNIDCVVLLRPTNSPGLYYQMVGRGFRLHESKTDCLVLDYGGNILRHGPVDAIHVKDKPKGNGDAPIKECPECQTIVYAATTTCPECGYSFPPPERETHDANASNEGILSGEIVDTEYEVQRVVYSVHAKRGAGEDDPKTLRIDYQTSLNEFHSEWVCPEHDGWARKKFEKWWNERSNDPIPETAELAAKIGNSGGIADAKTIDVRKVGGERFDRIVKYTLDEKPHSVSENFDNDETFNENYDPFEEGYNDDDIPF